VVSNTPQPHFTPGKDPEPIGQEAGPKHVKNRNKQTQKNCAPGWFYLQEYTGAHGQQNIKKKITFQFNEDNANPTNVHVFIFQFVQHQTYDLKIFCCSFTQHN
jgi:hypothetical protein